MTMRKPPENLEFRKKSFSSNWGNPQENQNETSAHSTGARVYIFHPFLRQSASRLRKPEGHLEEAVSLSAALDLQVIGSALIPLSKIQPATYLGRGKVGELAALVAQHDIELVIADCELSPGQQRNLERDLKVKVIDRTGLILEIFGERAQTREGVLQVELAHLTYQKSRLVRSWTHLERQRGGLGFIGGPGESQIESDRRMISERISKIRRQLDDVIRTRELHRAGRRKVPFPIIALVGYTNAGKSTLFNYLTNAEVMAEDLLFATLDPTMRNLELPGGKKVILSDTVGFISDLPTHLVAAFKATLEEVIEANIIIHVRDISHPDSEAQCADVVEILKSLGLEAGEDCIIHEVWNKIDLLDDDRRNEIESLAALKGNVTLMSAAKGQGMDQLLENISNFLAQGTTVLNFSFQPEDGAQMAWLYKHGEVLSRHDDENGTKLSVRMNAQSLGRLRKMTEIMKKVIGS